MSAERNRGPPRAEVTSGPNDNLLSKPKQAVHTATNRKTEMTATAIPSSPFLTAEQAAVELGTTPLAVRRLVARGVLKGIPVGVDAVRILPADLAAYAAAGLPDFERPPLDQQGGFRTEGSYVEAGRLDREIRETLTKVAAETVDAPSTPDVVVPIAGELAAIVNGPPYQPFARMAGVDYTAPFRSRAEGLAVNYLRAKVIALMMNSRTRTAGPVDVLYSSQTKYRDAVNAAWNAWSSASFSVRRTYPAKTALAQPKTVTFRVPYAGLAVDQQRVTQLAF